MKMAYFTARCPTRELTSGPNGVQRASACPLTGRAGSLAIVTYRREREREREREGHCQRTCCIADILTAQVRLITVTMPPSGAAVTSSPRWIQV